MSSLLGATLLPGGSELVLVGVLSLHPGLFWPALLLATLGNTLGGMITFGMGWLLPQFRHGGAGGAAPGPLTRTDMVPDEASRARTRQLKHVERVRRHGTPALLFAWLPFVGDALCLAAGWLRLNPWQAALFMLVGKLARYALVAYSV
ncbi:MAG: DedA family protein [Nitrosomonadales bacterium]|nr:DedA family protein [Nitrosomonadales bacterium]